MKSFERAGRWLFGFLSRHRKGVALFLVIALAVYFRFWQLNHLPPGLYEDEAANGLDVFKIQHHDFRPFYSTNNGREALFFYLQAIFVTVMGNTVLALRIAPALIGVAAVLMTYLLCKEWFSRRTALLASLMMATGSWAVTISRNGFRAGMVPLMIALTLWLVTKAVKQRRWYWYALTGISYGAGFYTYLSWRVTPLVLLLVMGFALVTHREWIKKFWKMSLIIGLFTALTLVPMGLYAARHPQEILTTRSAVSFTNPELNHGQPLQTLAKTIGKTALMFNFRGDSNNRQGLAGLPMLNAFVGIMFLLGLILALRRFKDIRYFTLLSIFGVMLLPEILTAEGIPHGLRAIGVLPVVYIFAAIGISELLVRWRGIFPRNVAAMSAALTVIVLLLLLSTYYDYKRYFLAWANDPATFSAYSEDAVAIATYLNSHTDKKLYVVVDVNKNRTVEYLTHNKANYERIDAAQVDQAPADVATQIIVVEGEVDNARPQLKAVSAKQVRAEVSNNRRGTVLYRVYEEKPKQ